MLFFGSMFLVVVSGLSLLRTNPSKGYVAGMAKKGLDSCFIAAGLCLIMAAALALKIKTREQLDAESVALLPEPEGQEA